LGSYVRKSLENFKYLLLPYSLVFLPGLVITVLCSSSRPLKDFIIQHFSASFITPWGVVTSLFVHGDVDHYISNLIATFLAIFIFTLINIEDDDVTSLSSFLFYSTLGIAILSNILWITASWIYSYPNIPSGRSFGSSGIGYALYGINIGLMMLNIFPHNMEEDSSW